MADKSIEETIEDLAKKQLDKCNVKYFAKTEIINREIDEALKMFPSKDGGLGKNTPDIKVFLTTPNGRNIPVMIEVKGKKGDLIKTDKNGDVNLEFSKPDKKRPDKKIVFKYAKSFAVNGAVHYATAILTHTKSYNEVIAIGINGYKEIDSFKIEYGVYYVSKENFGVPQKIADYDDLSFLSDTKSLYAKIDGLSLTLEQIEKVTQDADEAIENSLTNLSQIMYDQHNISEDYRVRIVAGMVMAGLMNLDVTDLKSEDNASWNDGQNFMARIRSFLDSKALPQEKKISVINLMSEVFPLSNLWKPINGESILKQIYAIVQSEILPYFKGNKYHLDFTGKLFNVLNRWVKIPDNKKNDVVLTPRYVCDFMVRLCRVNKDSFVWDYAMGTGGFLISAMKSMIRDCEKITNPEERNRKILKIKAEQLLGLEILNDIYVLAILNMILMNDGSANILCRNSLTNYEGKYEQGERKGEDFPADVFLLNPPYSEAGKGFNFVKKALSKMKKGHAAVLIQENAGSGNGLPYTADILKHSTLLASIKMPVDLFIGKSSVQTAIYVFEVGRAHDKDSLVKFIDFSNDGYARQSRRNSSANVNLRDVDDVRGRYEEILSIVLDKKRKTTYYTEDNGLYIQDTISLEGNDWTYGQHRKIDTIPTEEDFRKTVADYLSWKISLLIKKQGEYNPF